MKHIIFLQQEELFVFFSLLPAGTYPKMRTSFKEEESGEKSRTSSESDADANADAGTNADAESENDFRSKDAANAPRRSEQRTDAVEGPCRERAVARVEPPRSP